ncbi:MAG: NAD-dependent epimerase/dehydratase family protein [Candidatus Thermoplasmatota archaeon]
MNWEGRKVIITGGAGFIGSHLAKELLSRGASVTVFDNLSTGRLGNLSDSIDRLEVIRASTLEPLRLSRAMQGADTVFHLAAVLGVKRTWEEPIRVILENVQGTHNVLHAASDVGARKVVLASSSEVYGDGAPPYVETEGAAPRTGYAAAKLLEEKLAEAFTRETGLSTTSLRYFNVYGPGQECSAYGFVTAIFCDRVLQGLPPIVFGDGEQTRDFTFVQDTVRGTILAAEREANEHEVYNLGTGVETSIVRLARVVLSAAGRTDIAPVHVDSRADEVRRRVADARAAKSRLGWAPRVQLQQGLAHTLGTPIAGIPQARSEATPS